MNFDRSLILGMWQLDMLNFLLRGQDGVRKKRWWPVCADEVICEETICCIFSQTRGQCKKNNRNIAAVFYFCLINFRY